MTRNEDRLKKLVFVAGHPGRTDRLNTLASLEFMRDVDLPLRLDYLHNKEAFLLEYGRRGTEEYRQAKKELFRTQNSRKARIGGLEALRDASFMKRKADAETEFRSKFQASTPTRPDGRAAAWDKVSEAQKVAATIIKPYFYLERGFAFDSDLFTIARMLVRLAAEKTKPNSDRLEDYRDSALNSLEVKLYSEAPIYSEFEEARLVHSLGQWKKLMPDDPLVARVLHGRSVGEAAKQLVAGSKLADVQVEAHAGRGRPGCNRSLGRHDDRAGARCRRRCTGRPKNLRRSG